MDMSGLPPSSSSQRRRKRNLVADSVDPNPNKFLSFRRRFVFPSLAVKKDGLLRLIPN